MASRPQARPRHRLAPLRPSLRGGAAVGSRPPFAADAWARLDQVQELGPDGEGHTGCVNALSWSDDGSILLSGSDDKRICIWTADTRNPPVGVQSTCDRVRPPNLFPSDSEDEDDDDEDDDLVTIYGYPITPSPHPLRLRDTILTGHRANIFSAKFLPHANTPTIVSCAGDSDIRVFEVERLTTEQVGRRANQLYGINGPGVRVLRCHTDRTKRIATEDSPHLFLTVSEDGTVRQHDLRRPHRCSAECPDVLFNAPRGVDLYSLSMSPLAPHTFAVAGQADVAYICDRRMPEHQTPSWGSHTMRVSQVYCVRRLGLPDAEWDRAGVRAGGYGSERHITCVKISADHPDEVICAFANHSTSLFSLNDTPEDRGAAAGRVRGIVPNNTKHGSRDHSHADTASSPRSGASKRRMSDRTSNPASPSGRQGSRLRTDSAEPRRPGAQVFMAPTAALQTREEDEDSEDDKRELLPEGDSSRSRKLERFTFGYMTGLVGMDSAASGSGSGHEASSGQDGSDNIQIDNDDDDGNGDESGEEISLTEYLRPGGIGNVRDTELPQEGGIGNAPDTEPLRIGSEERQRRFLREERPDESDDDEETMASSRSHGASQGSEEETEMDMDMDSDDYDDDDDDGGRDSDDDEDEDDDEGTAKFKSVDILHPRRMFIGARNHETVKDCNFLGDASDKVCSGSDDGNWFLWDKLTGRLEGIWKGDDDVVNVMEQHPTLPLVAVSGIDHTVKMFAPLASRPAISMNNTADQARILRRNARRPASHLAESNALTLLSQILQARRAANPTLSSRDHLRELLSERAGGGAHRGGDDAGGPDSDDPDGDMGSAADHQCPLQ